MCGFCRVIVSMAVQQVCFGQWIFEPGSCALRRGDVHAVLEPRVSDLLEFFLAHPDEVHSHDRLVADVWHGQVVSDEAVRRAVSMLRRTADGALAPFIRTIYKRGYLASFPAPLVPSAGLPSTDQLIRECDASLTLCVSMPSPGRIRTREALECLRSAVELDPRLLEILAPSASARYVR